MFGVPLASWLVAASVPYSMTQHHPPDDDRVETNLEIGAIVAIRPTCCPNIAHHREEVHHVERSSVVKSLLHGGRDPVWQTTRNIREIQRRRESGMRSSPLDLAKNPRTQASLGILASSIRGNHELADIAFVPHGHALCDQPVTRAEVIVHECLRDPKLGAHILRLHARRAKTREMP